MAAPPSQPVSNNDHRPQDGCELEWGGSRAQSLTRLSTSCLLVWPSPLIWSGGATTTSYCSCRHLRPWPWYWACTYMSSSATAYAMFLPTDVCVPVARNGTEMSLLPCMYRCTLQLQSVPICSFLIHHAVTALCNENFLFATYIYMARHM